MQDGASGLATNGVVVDGTVVVTVPAHHRAATAATTDVAAKRIEQRPQYVPLIRHVRIRAALGLVLLALSYLVASMLFSSGNAAAIGLAVPIAWLASVFATGQYVHKYPQRHYPACRRRRMLQAICGEWSEVCFGGTTELGR